jgi:hypothetical protein
MALDVAFLTAAHNAARQVGGVTLSIDGGTAINAVIVSEDAPIATAGLVDGYDDARQVIEVAVLVADQSTEPESGSLVTITERSGNIYQIVPGSITGTIAEWRFSVVENQEDTGDYWLWADETAILWEDGTEIQLQ